MSTETVADPLLERLRAFIGAPSDAVLAARVPVNEAMIHHWCDALEDRNPVYTDPAAARTSAHGGVIAPPAMLQTWCMEGERRGRDEPIIPQVMDLLGAEGFTGVVATNYEQSYERSLRPGDRLAQTTELESVSDRKTTGLGEGYFVTFLNVYRDESGDVVGRARMRVLKFRPQPRVPAEVDLSAMPRPRPAVNRDSAFFWEGADQGELRIQRCAGCRQLRHPPAPMCPSCHSTEWDHVVAAGTGTIHSFVVHHHPPLPGFSPPFVIVLVELTEGTRVVSNLVDAEPDAVAVGQAVRLDFLQTDDDLTLPVFRLEEQP